MLLVEQSMDLGDKLRTVLASRNLGQKDLGAAIGRSQSRISDWMQGRGSPRPEELFKMAQFLGVDPVYLIDPDRESPEFRPVASTEQGRLVQSLVDYLGPAEALRRLTLAGDPARDETKKAPDPESKPQVQGLLRSRIIPSPTPAKTSTGQTDG